jgi:thioredoxin reductase (NADPH)
MPNQDDTQPTEAFQSSSLSERYEQTFPTLTPQEIERLRHFGSLRRYRHAERLFEAGRPGSGMFVVLSGHVAIAQRDGLGHITPIAEQGPGQFIAEVGQLSGQVALVDGYAEGDVEALLIAPDELRRLMIAEANLGERIMRALILRRVWLVESGTGGAVLVGPANSSDVIRLQGFLTRNSHPHHLVGHLDQEAIELFARCSLSQSDLPLVICPDGTVLRNPSERELARALGMTRIPTKDKLYDVAIIGSGPGGLATAVYAASEGLSVVVFDLRAFGGQAGASARIENYLGFPTGISGQALAGRAFVQAQKFGAEMIIPAEIKTLECGREDGTFVLETTDGAKVRARSVVIASGARYRKPVIENFQAFEGRGIWYWASPIEARLCAEQEVIVVGGGNSAGQAAVFLSTHAAKVRVMVRGERLADSMSRYLIDRIASAPNIELMTRTEIVALDGAPDGGLERVRWRGKDAGTETTGNVGNVFLFIGADPATSWLDGCGVELDRAGFVRTGAHCTLSTYGNSNPLQSSVPGVFAVGDVRSGSVKRVGGAIGEGAQVVAAIHRYLADASVPVA